MIFFVKNVIINYEVFMKKKNLYLILTTIVLILIIFVLFINNKNNLIELEVNDVIEKIDNKESFILCISATYCDHCNNYKPKLEKIAKEYDIKIYYIDFDKYNNEEQNKFKSYISFDGSTPVTVFIKKGEENTTSNRINGDISSYKIIEKLKINGFIDNKD